jgi:hypothetical protein
MKDMLGLLGETSCIIRGKKELDYVACGCEEPEYDVGCRLQE